MEYITNAPKGAALLDEKWPGWFQEIDMEEFNIRLPHVCALAQLYGSYSLGCVKLFTVNRIPCRDCRDSRCTYGFACEYGFDWNWPQADPNTLQAEWVQLISERLTA